MGPFRDLMSRFRGRLVRADSGFTMIEVAVAILIFGLLIGAVASMQGSTLHLIRNNRHRSVAANLAAQEMDTVRSTPFANLVVGQLVSTTTIDGTQYTITRESQWVPKNASAGACDAPQGSVPAYLRVNVAVEWPVMRGVQPIQAQTLITPPQGTYDSNSGHLSVRVLDRDGQPEEGVQVSISGPETASQFTSSDGCVFFAFLTAGAYGVTASKAGYVSDQGVAMPTQSVTVVNGTIASLSFLYDQAATLNLTLVGKDAGAPPPSAVDLTLFNTSILPSGTMVRAGGGATRSITGLVPFSSGYSVWAGRCADADPAFHSGGVRPNPSAVDPGAATSDTVLMPEVRVIVTVGGVPSPDRSIAAVHAPATGCPSGHNFGMGVTNATGELTFALPYGSWQIRVDNVVRWTGTHSPTDPAGPTIVTVAL